MKKLNQKGFTLIEGLLVTITLSLVVGVGYYVYNANKDKPAPAQTSQAQTMQTATKKTNYLVVKELGVKFDKSASPDAYYKIGDPTTSYPKVPELKTIVLYDKAYDNTTNSAGHKCGGTTPGSDVIIVEIMTAADRDSKYANYKNAEVGSNDDVPTVVSDKFNKQSGDLLYDYYKAQGVQAPVNCIGDVFAGAGDAADVDALAAKNGNVSDQFEKSYTNLKKVVNTLSQN